MNRDSMCTIRLFKRVYISIFAPVTLGLFIMSQGFLYSFLFLSSAIIHEISHLFFLYRFGAEIEKLTVFPFGADIRADTTRLSYKRELICTVAGSFSNLVFALTGALLLYRIPSPPLLFFILCNLFLGFMNLIPLSFFDGGKAIRLILYDCLDIDRAFYVCKYIDIISAFIFLCFSLLVVFGSNFNLSVISVIIYASISTLALYKKQTA